MFIFILNVLYMLFYRGYIDVFTVDQFKLLILLVLYVLFLFVYVSVNLIVLALFFHLEACARRLFKRQLAKYL